MKHDGYSIPGFFENCVIKGNEVKENKLFGKTLYRFSNHQLKEAKLFGSTVLVIKKDGIYKPGLFQRRLFRITEIGEVKEDKPFGRVVGAIPLEWLPGFNPDVLGSKTNWDSEDASDTSFQPEQSSTVIENDNDSTTYSKDINGVTITVTSSFSGNTQSAEELFVRDYVDVFAYAMFLRKYPVCKAPDAMKEDQYAHWQFMSCGVKDVNKLHRELFSNGFYKPASIRDKLSIYKVGEIKGLANALGISSSGKKDDVIQRISEQATSQQVNDYFQDNIFSLSAKAQDYLSDHRIEIEYYFENTDESLSLDEYIEKRKTNSPYDLKWQECLKDLKADDVNYGRNVYYRMSGICQADNRNEQALFYLIMVLRIDLSGVCAFKAIKSFPNESEFRSSRYSLISFAPGLIKDIEQYKTFYDETIVDDVYSRSLPIDASNNALMKEILSKLFRGEAICFDEYIALLKKKFEELTTALRV